MYAHKHTCTHTRVHTHTHMHTSCLVPREQSVDVEVEQLTQELMAAASSLATPIPGYTCKRKRIPYTLVEASKGNRLAAGRLGE